MRDALRPVRSSLRVLYDPDSFFAARRNRSALRAAGVVTLVAVLTTAGMGLVGWWFANSIDATRTVTTLEPWSNSTCARFAEMNSSSNASFTPESCAIDEPKTREVDVGAELWKGWVGRLPAVFVATFLAWLLIAAVLHVLSAVVDGEGSFGATLAVTGWGMIPMLFDTAIGLLGVYVTLQEVDFASDPELLIEQLQALTIAGDGTILIAVTVAVTLWQGYVWTYGLKHARNLEIDRAAIAAGVATAVALVIEIAG